jgi:hypothetical protein
VQRAGGAFLSVTASPRRTDELLNLIVISHEKEHQFRRSYDEDKGQALIESHTAFKDGLGETPDADSCMNVRLTPTVQYGVHGLANFLTLRF